MTVRAERNEIARRVYYVSRNHLRDRGDVMDMDKSLADIPVCLLKVKPTCQAAMAENSKTVHPVRIAALIAVYQHSHTSALRKTFRIDF